MTKRTSSKKPLASVQGEAGEFILYQTEDGQTRIECRFENETIWLSQIEMAALFQTTKQNIAKHLKAIFAEGELKQESVVNYWLTTATDGKDYRVIYYNLSAILAVGYRVRSHRGTQFRKWATERLGEYLLKGFTMDDERLKNPPGPGVPDYFDEMLERIRDIRSSEKRLYLRVRDIFTLAADYEANAAETQQFFQVIQNKLHWAATGQTAPELIASRADHEEPNMGLTAWKGSKVRRTDVTVAKNYLNAEEIAELNRIVSMYLDYAEDQAKRRKLLYMRDWREKLDAFLQFNEREILTNAGRVSREVADRLALGEFEMFEVRLLAHEAATEDAALEEALKKLPVTKRQDRP
jgi:hypothetical protein